MTIGFSNGDFIVIDPTPTVTSFSIMPGAIVNFNSYTVRSYYIKEGMSYINLIDPSYHDQSNLRVALTFTGIGWFLLKKNSSLQQDIIFSLIDSEKFILDSPEQIRLSFLHELGHAIAGSVYPLAVAERDANAILLKLVVRLNKLDPAYFSNKQEILEWIENQLKGKEHEDAQGIKSAYSNSKRAKSRRGR